VSIFNVPYKHDFKPYIALWERGFIPSFDGITWRLHQGPEAKVVCAITNCCHDGKVNLNHLKEVADE